eukprot:m.12108 g.12108  ORF g.12108 m.12108 type:complete len:566 (-) comp5802_c0_seq2:341-2038(-)
MSGDADVAEVCLAIFREYLARKGLTETLATLDRESPRTSSSITKRSDVARALHIESLVKQNKQRPVPYLAMLEIVVDNLVACGPNSQGDGQVQSASGPSRSRSVPHAPSVAEDTLHMRPKSRVNRTHRPSPPTTSSSTTAITSSSSSTVTTDAGPTSPTSRRSVRLHSHMQNSQGLELEDLSIDSVEVATPRSSTQPHKRQSHSMARSAAGVASTRNITPAEAQALRRTIFGSSSRAAYTSAWSKQNFELDQEHANMAHCLIQHEGGSCGVLAVVQARLIQHLVFGEGATGLPCSNADACGALVNAITDIIVLSQPEGDSNPLYLCLPGTRPSYMPGSFVKDGITEKIVIAECKNAQELRATVNNHIEKFTREGAPAVVLLLSSAILTHGADRVVGDMDESGSLMGRHNYCTLEMVNLLNLGYACSNVHNGNKMLGEGTDRLILKGTKQKATIGLLSLFEHYRSCDVGTNLKQPSLPIWIIYAESHFSVLFGTSTALVKSTPRKPFDINYHDQLARLEVPYTLTVDPTAGIPRPSDDELLPPLEHCMRTAWPGAGIDWHQCEPLF